MWQLADGVTCGQDRLHNLGGPAQNEIAGRLFKKYLKIQGSEGRIVLGAGPCVTAGVPGQEAGPACGTSAAAQTQFT